MMLNHPGARHLGHIFHDHWLRAISRFRRCRGNVIDQNVGQPGRRRSRYHLASSSAPVLEPTDHRVGETGTHLGIPALTE
jgi:hypothetical protein